jgi:hypothetical protein
VDEVDIRRIVLIDDALSEVKKARSAGAKGLFAREGYTLKSHLKIFVFYGKKVTELSLYLNMT